MREIIKLIVPSRVEALFYVFLSLVFYVLQLIKPIKLSLDNAAGVTSFGAEEYQNQISMWVNSLLAQISPRVIDFAAWLLIGSLTFMAMSVVVASIKSTNEDIRLLQYYKAPSSKRHEINVLLTKLALRTTGVMGLLFWLFLFWGGLNTTLTGLFFASLLYIGHFQSWVWLPLCVFLYALSLYLFAIFIRMVVLKVRLFGNY